jgi:replicative DNA helicase
VARNSSVQNVIPNSLKSEEDSILNGIIVGGRDLFAECADILNEQLFHDFGNKVVYESIKHLFESGDTISVTTILSRARDLGVSNSDLLETILAEQPADLSSIRNLASKLKKREIIKEATFLHRKSIDNLSKLTPDEELSKIFAVSESSLFDLITKFSNVGDKIVQLKDVVRELVDNFKDNPSDNVGLPTPWPKFNESIGGGMRTGVTLIGARSGVGKTFLGTTIANYLAMSDIPVLILDTEMEYKDILPRMIANLSGVPIREIESGEFAQNSLSKNMVYSSVDMIEKMPHYYKSVAGNSFDEILSTIRRWVYKDVGIRKDGKANECLIIYDYFKIMDSGDMDGMAEFQAMGFQISKLTDFCKAYDLPCLSFVQLNRDGVAKETTDVIAQSDRLLWLSNSFSIFKLKSEGEAENDGADNGNRKMITLKSRYGGEHQYGQYISMQFKGETASLLEVSDKQNTSEKEDYEQ